MSESEKPALSHLDDSGSAHMVDVGGKAVTNRTATARARVTMSPATSDLLTEGSLPKGDALAVARIAGIMAAKRTPDLIPLCHPIGLTSVTVDITVEPGEVTIAATTATADRTGVEMEAMVAAGVAAFTLYDMIKGVDPGAVVSEVAVLSKRGGASGDWEAQR